MFNLSYFEANTEYHCTPYTSIYKRSQLFLKNVIIGFDSKWLCLITMRNVPRMGDKFPIILQ